MSSLISLNRSFASLSKALAVSEIIHTNDTAQKFGLVLTAEEALELIESRSMVLQENGRVEVGGEVIPKIIIAFCTSSFIWQDTYLQTLHDLIEIFYYIKNETLELISDDELIEIMRECFENRCRGSLELLRHRELEILARNLRYDIADYQHLDHEAEDLSYDEEDL